jgi:hypothetical protein
VFLAIIAAALLQGILAALIVLPILATIGLTGRYIRARLLNLEPWPDDAESFASDEPTPAPTAVDPEAEESPSAKLKSA